MTEDGRDPRAFSSATQWFAAKDAERCRRKAADGGMTHKPTSDDIGMAVVFVVFAPVLSLAFFRFGLWVWGDAGRLAAEGEIVGSWVAYAVLLPVGAIVSFCVCSGLLGLLTLWAGLMAVFRAGE